MHNTHNWSEAINSATDKSLRNDDVIQLGALHSQSLFQFVQIGAVYFVQHILQQSP